MEDNNNKYLSNNKLSDEYFKELIETENDFYNEPSINKFQKLLELYKYGTEYFSKHNDPLYDTFQMQVKNISLLPSSIMLLQNEVNKKNNKNVDENNNNNKPTLSCTYKFKLESVDSFNFNNQVKVLMQQGRENKNNFKSTVKKEIENQKLKLKKKLEKKVLRNQIVNQYSRRNSVNSTLSSAEKRKNSVKIKKENNRQVAPVYKPPNKVDELMEVLNQYPKKLYNLFKNNIENSLDEFNKIISDSEEQKYTRIHEYLENLADYLDMGDDLSDLIFELQTDYKKDINSIDEEEDKKIDLLCDKLRKSKLNQNLSIGNLNMEIIGEIINIIK